MEVSYPRGKRLYVSGTASIDGVGRTLHPGHLSAQVDRTFRVVRQLLDSRGFCFDDVTQAICYLAQDDDGSLAKRVGCLPQAATVRATICREDLEFELELVAERPAD
jgi:enamine deaminase RidA (YjgF/YER057c/UK114 family)